MNWPRTFVILVVAIAMAISARRHCVAQEPDEAERMLEASGLKRIGGVWLAAEELEIRERLAAVERLERRFLELRKQADLLIDQNQLLRAQLEQANAAHKRMQDARKAAKGGSPQQKQLDEELKRQGKLIEQLKRSIVEPEKLGATMPLKGTLMELSAVRSELAVHLLLIARRVEELPQVYERLRQRREVSAALARLPANTQLGSGKTYASNLRSLDRIERRIFGDVLPLYREGKHLRVSAIANEELPITFTIYQNTEPTVITYSMAEALGLSLAGKQPVNIRIDGGGNVAVQKASLASLRFGRHVMKDVEVHVLPPEAEHFGARLSLGAFKGARVTLNAERLRLRFEEPK